MIFALRTAFRQLRRSKRFTLTTILILGIGIGVTTAMYGVLYAVILRPLPFSQPDQLVALSAQPWSDFSFPTLEDWQRRTHAFKSMAAYGGWSPRIESSAGIGHADVTEVSKNFLPTLGAKLALGRNFSEAENEAACLDQVIVTDSYWRRMGGGSSLSGRTVQLDHKTYAVIGVLEPIETGGTLDGSVILTPISCGEPTAIVSRGNSSFQGVGRLQDGVSISEALAELTTAQKQISRDYPDDYPKSYGPMLIPYTTHEIGVQTSSALYATLAACGTLLLISCANLCNLLLARNTRRRSEFAIRSALGASPRNLMQQMLAENCILAILGLAIGLTLADFVLHLVRELKVVHLPRIDQAGINLHVIMFAAGICLLISIFLTILPTFRSLGTSMASDLSNGTSRASGVVRLHRSGRLLVAFQLALALVLVASAGWMVSSVFLLLHQPLGFEPHRLLFASMNLQSPLGGEKRSAPETLAVLRETLVNLSNVPGVVNVAAANDKPLGGRVNRYDFCSDLHPDLCKRPNLRAPDVFQVTPDYFRTLGQVLHQGRDFNVADDGRAHVAIVNRALANQEWPGENPVGHRIFSGQFQNWATVVGEVGDVHSFSLERAPVPNLYLPEADGPDSHMTLMVRTSANPNDFEETIRRILRSDGKITTNYVRTMPELMASQVALRRFAMQVTLVFGALALALANFGVYGLLAYEVSLREREVGIRLALGSTRRAIVQLLVLQEARWIGAGIGVGLAAATVIGFLLRAQFFHTEAMSAPVLIVSGLFLAGSSLFAVAVPGRRASLLEPAVTLKRE